MFLLLALQERLPLLLDPKSLVSDLLGPPQLIIEYLPLDLLSYLLPYNLLLGLGPGELLSDKGALRQHLLLEQTETPSLLDCALRLQVHAHEQDKEEEDAQDNSQNHW